MTIENLVEQLPSNVFFDFIKEHYVAFFEFLDRVLKIFHVDLNKLGE